MKFIRCLLCVLLLPLIIARAQTPVLLHEPSISIWVASDMAPSAKINVTVNTRNVPVVHIAAYRLDAENWLSHMGDPERKTPSPQGNPVTKWDSKLDRAGEGPADKKRDTFYSRETRVPKLSAGVYLLYATAAGNKTGQPHASAVINVTDLGVVIKRSPSRSMVWVTDVRNGQPITDAKVGVFNSYGVGQTSGNTGVDGSAVIPMRPGISTFVISRGKDHAGLRSGAPNPDGELRAHFETDRPIYRPGQTIFFKAILRRTLGQGYSVDAGSSCVVMLRDPKENPVDLLNLTSNAMGSVNGQFSIPNEGMTGPYSLILTTSRGTAYQTVSVAEYRKPQFKVDVIPTQRHFLAGETGSFRVNANYYFGAPVQQAEVHYAIRWSGAPFNYGGSRRRFRRSGNGNLYPRDTYAANQFNSEDTAYTDERGQVTIPFKTAADAPDSDYSIELTVIDKTRQQVTASGSVPVYAAAIRIGISTDLGYAMLNEQVPIDVQARDLEGQPAAARVDLELSTEVWDEVKKKTVVKVLSKKTVQVPKSGKLRTTVYALHEGELTLKASAPDGTGRTAKADMSIWVAGPYEKVYREKEQPSVAIRLDHASYQPGDLVKAYVTTNRPRSPLVITVEGGDIWIHKIIKAPKTGQRFEFRATSQMSPNAFVSAGQWTENRYISAQEDIPMPNPANEINVSVTPDKPDYRPGDKATFKVRATDHTGAPTKAEVALAVVDEAIYALSPDSTDDLYEFYWSMRGNRVTTIESAPVEMAGGAYQRVSTVAPLRQRFEDTAYWIADLTTGVDGNGVASFEMPGNLTTWRATALGVTSETSVGGATAKVKANRPTMLRIAAPRAIVQGDRITLIGTLDNRTQSAHEYDVLLHGEGITLHGSMTSHLRVEAGRQATVQWDIEAVKLPEDGMCTLIGEAVATDVSSEDKAAYSDAVEAKFPIAAAGLREDLLQGGAFSTDGDATLTLPSDRIEPASTVKLRVWHGLDAVRAAAADEVLKGGRWGPSNASHQLEVAALTGLKPSDEVVREALALISRTQQGGGWGWWDGAYPRPTITADVLVGLTAAHAAHLDTYTNLVRAAQAAAEERYNQTNLWEDRARLAAVLQESETEQVDPKVEEVLRRGKHLSPFSRLRLAEAMMRTKPDDAKQLAESCVQDVSEGPDSAYLPTGFGVGWTASDTESTAQMLRTFVRLGVRQDLQQKLARWLAKPGENRWRSTDDNTAIVRALTVYVAQHPEPPSLGDVTLSVNGTNVTTTRAKLEDAVTASIPRSLLKETNQLTLHRSEGGEAFYSIDSSVFRPLGGESTKGIRVIRRFEIQNEAGIWVEIHRPVHPAEPVRCTTIIWGDDVPDAVRIIEPIPAGFELIDEPSGQGRVEVRDAAVIHYLENSGNPVSFRYYIRAESEGQLKALPSIAEYIRRPDDRGNSHWQTIEVKVAP